MGTDRNKNSLDDAGLTSRSALTPRIVARAVCPAGAPSVTLWDPAMPGFGLRIYATGRRTFVFQYRPQGARRTVRLTVSGVVLAEGAPPVAEQLRQARARAFEWRAEVETGGDPQARMEAARAPGGDSLALALQDYGAHYRRAARSAPSNLRQLEKLFGLLPEDPGGVIDPAALALAATPPAELTRAQLLRRLDRIAAERGPAAANRRQAYAAAFLRWLEERERVPGNVLYRVRRTAVENPPRDRVLNDGELARVMAATGPGGPLAGGDFAAIVRLLLFTGQRRREIAELVWAEVDRRGHCLNLPAARVKNKRAHRVPLSPQAWAELSARPARGRFVFARPSGGVRPFAQYSYWKGQLDRITGVQDWRLHDLRRTFATGLYSMGAPREVVEAALNHRSGTLAGVAGVYARHDYQDEIRTAAGRWAEHLLALESGAGVITAMGVKDHGKKHRPRVSRRARA